MAEKRARFGIPSMDDFWIEGANEAWVEDGWLYQNADPDHAAGLVHSTAWLKRSLPCNVAIAMSAEVLGSSVGANNINLFLAYSDPSGTPLPESRVARRDGAYAHYHDLDGYIFTFLRDFRGLAPGRADRIPKARYRFRRCPGFELKVERFGERCEAGITVSVPASTSYPPHI
jgi:hypothetical protein